MLPLDNPQIPSETQAITAEGGLPFDDNTHEVIKHAITRNLLVGLRIVKFLEKERQISLGNNGYVECPVTLCEEFERQLCPAVGCTDMRCYSSRALIRHWMGCSDNKCHICEPFNHFLVDQFIQFAEEKGPAFTCFGILEKMKSEDGHVVKSLIWKCLKPDPPTGMEQGDVPIG